MEDRIRVKNADWLFNCGILGLYNILTYRGGDETVFLSEDELNFSVSSLEGFSDKYFRYLIDTYEKTLSIYRITSFKEFLDNHENNEFHDFNTTSLQKLNEQIEQTKKYLKSNSYVSAYQLIDCKFDPLKKEKELKKISLKKKEVIIDKFDEIRTQVGLLREIIHFFERKDVRKYIGGKNTMYSVIRNAWEGISFMNTQNKNPDMYDEMENYFVNPLKEYIEVSQEEKKKFKYQCMTCSSNIKDLKNGMGFMNKIGFDVGKKTSHVWDFTNYVAICPICKLVYACVPAGFSYLYNRGIFVNYSMDLEELVRVNTRIKKEVMSSSESNTLIYQALQNQMNKEFNENSSYELSDVQVVRFDRDPDKESIHYTFNILSRSVLLTVQKSKKEFDRIRNASFAEGKHTLYLYNEVMKRLLNNENQFLLIQKLIHYKLSMSDRARYSMAMVRDVLKINVEFLKEAGYMEKGEKEIIKMAKSYGHYLQKKYGYSSEEGGKPDKYNKKLDGIAYRMLNALKTNNKHAFMDVMINAHMYVQKEIPGIFAEYLDKDLEFKNMGYAFITGMIGYSGSKEDSENEGGKSNE